MASYCSWAVRGMPTPARPQAHWVSPEQSKPTPGLSPAPVVGDPDLALGRGHGRGRPAGRRARGQGAGGPELVGTRAGPVAWAAGMAATRFLKAAYWAAWAAACCCATRVAIWPFTSDRVACWAATVASAAWRLAFTWARAAWAWLWVDCSRLCSPTDGSRPRRECRRHR